MNEYSDFKHEVSGSAITPPKPKSDTPRTDAEQFTRDLIYALRGELPDKLQNMMPTFQDDVDTILPMVKERESTLELNLNDHKKALKQSNDAAEKTEQQLAIAKELIEKLVEALRCANNSFFGSPGGQDQINKALQLAHSQGYGKKGSG